MIDKSKQGSLRILRAKRHFAGRLAIRPPLMLMILFTCLFSPLALKGCLMLNNDQGIKDEMISHVEEKFGKIEYEIVSFQGSTPFDAFATLHAHVPGIEGEAGDFWVRRYVVDGKSIVRDGHEVGDVIFEDSYYRVLVHKKFEAYAQSVASEVFPVCKVSVDIRGNFSDDIIANTPMAEAFRLSPSATCSVIVLVEGDYFSAEEFMEASRPLLEKWVDAGVALRTGIRCFLMKPGEYDRVDMMDPMSVYDKKAFIYDISIYTRDESIMILS